MRSSSIRVVSARRASSSGVSLGILFLFAIVLPEQNANRVQVRPHVAEQLHDRRDITMRDQRLHRLIVPLVPCPRKWLSGTCVPAESDQPQVWTGTGARPSV
jgi:hypothetical protein